MDTELYNILNRPRILDKKLQDRREEIEIIFSKLLPGSIRYDKDIVQTSPEDSTSKLIARKVALEAECDEILDQWGEAYEQVVILIDRIENPDYRIVMKKRYLGNQMWETIARDLNFSIQTIFLYHRNGVEILEKVIHN
jgi:hypothetical protein